MNRRSFLLGVATAPAALMLGEPEPAYREVDKSEFVVLPIEINESENLYPFRFENDVLFIDSALIV